MNTRHISRPAKSVHVDYGPKHVMVLQDIEYLYGFEGEITKTLHFTGIFVAAEGNSYDPADPPVISVLFNGQDLGVVAEPVIVDGKIKAVEVTDWGLNFAPHTGDDATIQANWNSNSGWWELDSVDVLTPGSGYGTAPWVIIGPYGGNSGESAVARAYLDGYGGLDRIEVVRKGSYYLNQGWYPHPTVTLEDPPTEYPCIPEIVITDPYDNTSATLYAKVGAIVLMDSPNHHIESGSGDCRLCWRGVSGGQEALRGPLGPLDVVVSGREVSISVPTWSDPSTLQDGETPPPEGTRVWLMPPKSAFACTTPWDAGCGQAGFVKYNGLAKIVLDDPGGGYTPGSQVAVTIFGGTCSEAAAAVGEGLEDGSLRVRIINQGKGYTAAPTAVQIAAPPAGPSARQAVAHAVIATEAEAFTVRMYNPWDHGIREGDELQVCWKEGEGILWQYMQQAGRYGCLAAYVGNGCVTFTGGMNGPDPNPTTLEVKDPAGAAWIVPPIDDYTLSLFAGRVEKNVLLPRVFGLFGTIVRQGVDRDLVDLTNPLPPGQLPPTVNWWGWCTDVNAFTHVS
jgi:hypothetical protein